MATGQKKYEKNKPSTASTVENAHQRCRVLKTLHLVRKSKDKTISLSGMWQHCTSAIRNLPSQHNLVPSHRNVYLFDRKLIITSVKFYLCQTSNSDASPTNFTNAWPVITIDWARTTENKMFSTCNSPRLQFSITVSRWSWFTVLCWHSIYRTYLWLLSSDAFSKCWVFWLFDTMHSQHSHKIKYKIFFIIILKPCNLYLLYAYVPTKLHLNLLN
jgi:hypothetical protein